MHICGREESFRASSQSRIHPDKLRLELDLENIDVLDKGFVRLVDYMGSDDMILNAARVSTGASSKGAKRDRGLIRYLYRNAHTSPFEMSEFIFHIKAPLFVARQWMRHRTASVNETSGRYRELPTEFYEPETWREQATKNHQGSEGEVADVERINQSFAKSLATATKTYQSLLRRGVAREMARLVLPVTLYTEWYWKIDLHNLMHFLSLRMDAHAQWEIRQYAEAVRDLVDATGDFPYTMEIFSQMREVDSQIRDLLNEDREFETFFERLREDLFD